MSLTLSDEGRFDECKRCEDSFKKDLADVEAKLAEVEAERDKALAIIQSLCDQKKTGCYPEVRQPPKIKCKICGGNCVGWCQLNFRK